MSHLQESRIRQQTTYLPGVCWLFIDETRSTARRAKILGSTLLATGMILTGCAQQDGQGAPATQSTAAQPAPVPAPTPAPQSKQPSYNLNGGTMTVVTEPAPEPRRTSAALDLVQANTLLDVARQASIRVVKADADGNTSVINAVALPTTDVAVRLEQALLGRLGNVFSLAVRVNQVGNPSRAFPFTPEGAVELAGQLSGAGLKGYALDVRTEFLDLETTGGTISDPVERFSLNGQVQARLIDVSDGQILRQATCSDNQQMGTLRDIFVAEGRPVPASSALEAAAEPAPATAEVQTEQAISESTADDGSPRPASETSAAALALIQKTNEDEKSQRIAQPSAAETEATTPAPEAGAVAATTPEAPVEAEAQAVADEAVAAVSAPSAPAAQTPEVETPATPTPQPEAAATPAPQPTPEERVQAALRQAAPTRAEVAAREAEQASFQPSPDNPREVPIRRTGAFSGVVQSAIEETPEDPLRPRRRVVNVEDTGVKEKAMLPVASLAAAQATTPVTYPGPGPSGRVADGAAERFIRKCTEELWLKIVPE